MGGGEAHPGPCHCVIVGRVRAGPLSCAVRVSSSWIDYLPCATGSPRPPPGVANWPGGFTGLGIGSFSRVTVEGYHTGHGPQRGRHRPQRPGPAPSPLLGACAGHAPSPGCKLWQHTRHT